MTALIVALVGVALLAALALAVAWQERRRLPERAITYGVEESISFVLARLAPGSRAVLSEPGVRRIMEWSVLYLQDPEVRTSSGEPPVAGSLGAAHYVQDRALRRGFAYDGDLIMEVLELQTRFLASLGAIGDVVTEFDDAEGSGGE